MEEKNNVVIASFKSYNSRRYSRPWVCKMTTDHQFDFTNRVGCYDADDGDAGDLVIYKPEIGAIYAYGQKDYRNSKYTWKEFVRWDGNDFIECTKTGREKK